LDAILASEKLKTLRPVASFWDVDDTGKIERLWVSTKGGVVTEEVAVVTGLTVSVTIAAIALAVEIALVAAAAAVIASAAAAAVIASAVAAAVAVIASAVAAEQAAAGFVPHALRCQRKLSAKARVS
jgi:hypothetical protein